MKMKISRLFTLLVLGALSFSFTLMVEAATTSGTVVAWGLNSYGQTTVPTGLSSLLKYSRKI
ncbi:MAG: hypothetical protein HY043_22865 [Verrucomicrobia bacterium]|nr:hypothetical protein [Verrucomicrobiota bacterium]